MYHDFSEHAWFSTDDTTHSPRSRSSQHGAFSPHTTRPASERELSCRKRRIPNLILLVPMAPSSNEAASAAVAMVATAGAAMYYLQNGEMFSSKTESDEPRSIAERMAAVTDEDIIAMFDEKIDMIENKAKEVVEDGYHCFLRHKTAAIVTGVLVIVFLIFGWVAVMRMRHADDIHIDGKERSSAPAVPTEMPTTTAIDELHDEDDEISLESPRTPENGEKQGYSINCESAPESTNTNFSTSTDKSLDEKASCEEKYLISDDTKSVVTVNTDTSKETRNKISIRTPIKNGVLRTPIRKKRVRKVD